MGKVSHRTIKQFFFSNSDQSWNIKKKRNPGSSILYYLQSDWTAPLRVFSFFPFPSVSLFSHCQPCLSLPFSFFSTILIPAMIPSSQFCCFAAGLSKCHCMGPSPWDQESLFWRRTCSCWWLESSQRASHSPSYAAGGCWVMVSAKSSKRPWLPVQYLKAAPACWKTDLKEEGCSPWPQSNDISSSVKETLTEGSVSSQMRDFWLVRDVPPPVTSTPAGGRTLSEAPACPQPEVNAQSAHKKGCQSGQREGTDRTASSSALCVRKEGLKWL